MVGVILTTFNFLNKTRVSLSSFLKATTYPHRLVVVDNHSTDGTLEYLRQKGLEVIPNSADTSLATALNQGIRHFLANPKIAYIAWIHNDMLFFPGWLKELVRMLKERPAIGKLAPHNLAGDPSQHSPANIENFRQAHRDHLEVGNACPWLMRKAVVQEVGLFNESYLRCGGYEDWDYNNRLLEKGYGVFVTRGSVVWHEGMGTRKHIPQEEAAQHNAHLYTERWGPGSRA
ncbi:MAG: glycosyltransferase family 2 protein [Firmicutes bacterium]|nr:glycosyltransferase family 2 protein [Bacillota bacterium]MCL5040827.1 glycosyltransferase family 2 protein [Bacillota bacterium]